MVFWVIILRRPITFPWFTRNDAQSDSGVKQNDLSDRYRMGWIRQRSLIWSRWHERNDHLSLLYTLLCRVRADLCSAFRALDRLVHIQIAQEAGPVGVSLRAITELSLYGMVDRNSRQFAFGGYPMVSQLDGPPP
jgi:hypothetical protein